MEVGGGEPDQEASMPTRRLAAIGWRIYTALLVVAGVVLLILNGREDKFHFQVDQVSLLLLLGLAIPALAKYLDEVKAGDWHFKFRAMSVEDQLLLVMPEIGRGRLWTFYEARAGEQDIGGAFRLLFEVLLEQNRPKLLAELRRWLASDDSHLKWLATEVVGYFHLEELKANLKPLYAGLGADQQWERWQLNALWAYSRFSAYHELQEFLLETSDSENQIWLLFTYPQMLRDDPSEEMGERFIEFIDEFLAKNPSITRRAEMKAEEAREQLRAELRELPGRGTAT